MGEAATPGLSAGRSSHRAGRATPETARWWRARARTGVKRRSPSTRFEAVERAAMRAADRAPVDEQDKS